MPRRFKLSRKCFDLRADSYNTYDKLYKQLDTDLRDLQKWDGFIDARGFDVRPGNIAGRRLDVAIPDRAIDEEQIRALQDFARYAAECGLLFRVTVIK